MPAATSKASTSSNQLFRIKTHERYESGVPDRWFLSLLMGLSLANIAVSAIAADKPAAARPRGDASGKPLKVFILAGQSNMQGHASVSTFDSMADDPKTAPLLEEMRGPDGKPRVCEKVWISSVGCLGDAYSDLREQTGKLTAGFGAPTDKIGPEFTFGLTMEKKLDEPILIIKTAWGGRSLHTDFRPPSAGPYVWSEYELTQCKERGDDLDKIKAEKVTATGLVLPPHDRPRAEGAQGHQAGGAGLRPEAGVRAGRVRLVPGVQRLGFRLDLRPANEARRVRPVRRTARPPDPRRAEGLVRPRRCRSSSASWGSAARRRGRRPHRSTSARPRPQPATLAGVQGERGGGRDLAVLGRRPGSAATSGWRS